VNHKKVKIDVSALDIAFKLDYWVQITPLIDFAPKKILNQTGSAQETPKTHVFLEIIPPGRHYVVTFSRLRLNRY